MQTHIEEHAKAEKHEVSLGMTIASLAVGTAFFALWLWLLPQWLGFHVVTTGAGRLRWIAMIPAILGFALAMQCVWNFGKTGHGTPAPMIPPKKLVVVGWYRYVRNPMYVGFVAGWGGLWVVFGRANLASLIAACVVVIFGHLFVVFYEEPTLRKLFGAGYEEYCKNVRRWVPRLHPWNR